MVTHTGTNNRAQRNTPKRWCMSGRNLQNSRYRGAVCFRFSKNHIGFQGRGKDGSFRNSHLCIAVGHIVNHLTHLTIKPAITRLHQKEPTNPKPPQKTPTRTHVVNRKQIYKGLCWSRLIVVGRLDNEWLHKTLHFSQSGTAC